MKISIKKKMASFLLLLFLPSLLAGILILSLSQGVIGNFERAIREGNDAIIPVLQLESMIQKAVSSPRRYLVRGDQNEISHFIRMVERIEAHFRLITRGQFLNEEERGLIQETFGYWIVTRIATENLLEISNPEGHSEAVRLMSQIDLMSRKASVTLGGFFSISHWEREKNLKTANFSYHMLTERVSLLIFSGLLMGFVVFLSMTRKISENLSLVAEGAKRLARGEMGHTIEISTGDEFESIAIEFNEMAKNIRHRIDTIKHVASHDGLTGLLNHNEFYASLHKEFNRGQRHHHPMTLLMLDVDHFKRFNDQYGHQMGDLALKKVSLALKQSVRQSDLVARYGGEEFSVLLPETDLQEGLIFAERIREKVEQIKYLFDGNLLEENPVAITVSIGVASLPEDAKSPDELVFLADQFMYVAKRSGRNRICQQGDQYQSINESRFAI